MKKFLTISFLILFQNNLGYSQFEAVKNFQKEIIKNEITGSNVVMIYKEGKVVFLNAENSNLMGDKKISNQSYKPYQETLFPIWSMSKPITVVSIMILVEKGLIKLDDNVSKYLPEYNQIYCKGKSGKYLCKKPLKIIHLLTHRSGFGYYSHQGYGYGLTSTIKYDNLNDFSKDLSKVVLEFEPGEKYYYGVNQALLGRVVEVVSRKNFYEFLNDEIFEPLEMNETKFYLTQEDRSRFQPLYINFGDIKGFTSELDELTYEENNKAYFGGEGLISTMNDYSNFCIMLLNSGVYKGKRIISEKSIGTMTKKYSSSYPIEEFADTSKLGFNYGFSMFVLDDPLVDGTRSTKGIYGWSGYHGTHFWIDPEKKMFGLFMSRHRQNQSNIDVQKELRKAVYYSAN
jgi:CubicO group peptidase (beta-lactamase class C family)